MCIRDRYLATSNSPAFAQSPRAFSRWHSASQSLRQSPFMILLEQLAIDRRRNIRTHDLLPSARSNQPLDHARTHLRDLARWQQKNGREPRREVAIDISHEALVFEIRAGANPSQDVRRADGARVVDEVFVLE